MTTDRRYALYRAEGETREELVPMTRHARIDPGMGNGLVVLSRGTTIELFLDGELLTSVDDGRSHEGAFGVFALSGTAAVDATWEWVSARVPK